MGIVFFPFGENAEIFACDQRCGTRFCTCFINIFKKPHTSQTFLRRPFKKQYSVGTHPVLGSAISPSHVPHVTAAAFRAQVNVNVPGRLQQFGHGKVGIPFFETPVSLDGKNQFQVLCLVPVVQETIVSDLLETGRQHVHQVAPDKLGVRKRDGPTWFARPLPPGGKSHPLFVNGQDAAVRYRDLVGVPSQVFHGVVKWLLRVLGEWPFLLLYVSRSPF